MGKQKRSQNAGKPPLSSHPLFPAIVALWFGALFGLGSLAIRKSLLETVVLATQIDTVFESAAPPLGMTARIALALAMAVVGAIIGGIFARMLARPKVEKPARRRKASPSKASQRAENAASGPTRFGRNAARAAEVSVDAPVEPGRKRSLLASSHEEAEPEEFDFRNDSAPLPGGPPEIFDVNASEIATWKQHEIATEVASEMPDALDLSHFEAAAPIRMNGASSGLDEAQDVFASSFPASFADQPAAEVVSPELAALAEPIRPFEMPLESAELAGIEPAIPVAYEPDAATNRFAPPPMETFAPPAEVYDAASRFAEPSQFDEQVVSFAPAQPVLQAENSLDMALQNLSPMEAEAAMPAAAIPKEYAPEHIAQLQTRTAFSDSAADQSNQPVELETTTWMETMELPVQPEREAQPFAKANLDALTSAELLDRLANSIRRFSAPRAANVRSDTPLVTSTSVVPPSAVPGQPVAPVAAVAPHPHLTIPAALQPINFSEYEDDDDDADNFLPQRSMTMPKIPSTPLAEPTIRDELSALQRPILTDKVAPAELDVAEEEYSSLLDMSRPSSMRQGFLRIDEPDSDDDGLETVVVFPGQGGQAGSRFAAPTAQPQPAPNGFGAPAISDQTENLQPARNFAERPEFPQEQAAQFQQPSTPAAPAAIDPAETERALRSALANLQRMTGAA